VAHVTRLVTFVEVDDTVADARQLSVSARHEAVLMNGGRVLLLADRGWSASGPPDIWEMTTVEEITDTAHMVVGPDEPFGGRSQKDMEADQCACPRLGPRDWGGGERPGRVPAAVVDAYRRAHSE
jgi:hypothetical protein